MPTPLTDDELLKRPVVVVGAPRSGTTLLCQMLGEHPDFYLAREPRVLWKYGNDSKSDALTAGDARPEVVRHIRKEFARRIREAGKQRLIEKTPSNALRLGFVKAVLPDAIFLHVMRAGAESVLSIRSYWQQHSSGIPTKQLGRRVREIKLRQTPYYAREFFRRVASKVMPGAAGPTVWGPRLPGIEDWLRDRDLLDVCALQWRMCVEMAVREGRHMPADSYTECPLEELDAAELGRLVDYCGLRPSAEVDAAFREKFDARQPGGRSKAADEAELKRVQELIAPTVTWLETLRPAHNHRQSG
ncbi:MAG: sulfotransferase [Planctomycetota bacterium]